MPLQWLDCKAEQSTLGVATEPLRVRTILQSVEFYRLTLHSYSIYYICHWEGFEPTPFAFFKLLGPDAIN